MNFIKNVLFVVFYYLIATYPLQSTSQSSKIPFSINPIDSLIDNSLKQVPVESIAVSLSDELFKLDKHRETDSLGIYIYGRAFNVDIDFFEYATIDTLLNGDRILRLKFLLDSAKSLEVNFSKFLLNKNSRLHIFDYLSKK